MKYWIVILLLIFEFGNCILEKVSNDDEDKKRMNFLMKEYMMAFTAVKNTKDQQTVSDLDIIQQLMVQSWIKLLEPSKEQINEFLLPENLKKETDVKNIEEQIISDLKKKGQTRVDEAVLLYDEIDYEIVLNYLIERVKKELKALNIEKKDITEKLIRDPILLIHDNADKLYLQSYLFDFVTQPGTEFTIEPTGKASERLLKSIVMRTADYSETDWKKVLGVKEITLEQLAKPGVPGTDTGKIFVFGNYILVGKNDNERKEEMNSLMMKYFKDFTAVKNTKDSQTAADLDIVQQLMVQSWIRLLEPSKEQINQFLLPENLKEESNVKNVENKIILDLKKKGQTRVDNAVFNYDVTNYYILLDDLTAIAKKELKDLKIEEKDIEKNMQTYSSLDIHNIADKLCLQSYQLDFVVDRDGSQFTVKPKENTPGRRPIEFNTADYSEKDWKKFFEIDEIELAKPLEESAKTLEESAKTGSIFGQDLSDEEIKQSINDYTYNYLAKFAEIKNRKGKTTAADMDIIQQMVVQSWITMLKPTMEQITEFLPEDLKKENNLDSVKTKITTALKEKGRTPVSEAILSYFQNDKESVGQEIAKSVTAGKLTGSEGAEEESNSMMVFHDAATRMLLQSYLFDFFKKPYGQNFNVKPEKKSKELKELVFETKMINELDWHIFFGVNT